MNKAEHLCSARVWVAREGRFSTCQGLPRDHNIRVPYVRSGNGIPDQHSFEIFTQDR